MTDTNTKSSNVMHLASIIAIAAEADMISGIIEEQDLNDVLSLSPRVQTMLPIFMKRITGHTLYEHILTDALRDAMLRMHKAATDTLLMYGVDYDGVAKSMSEER
jgi:hypothetical protein